MKERYLRALVKLTRAASAPTLDATIEHMVYGKTQELAAQEHGVKQEAVARLTSRLVNLDKQITVLIKLKDNS